MKKTFKAFQVAALLSAVSGASVLLVSGATPAKAGEERLHSSSFKLYGLIPPGESNKGASNSSGIRSSNTASLSGTTMTKSGSKRGSGSSTADNEPKIEDPPMPSYDGPSGGNTLASNEGSTPGYN